MNRVKKIILFVIGLLTIPEIVAYSTAFIFKIDMFEHAFFECLFVDYMLTYILIPLLYKPKIQKYISNKYVFFALVFFLFWLWEMFRIAFI